MKYLFLLFLSTNLYAWTLEPNTGRGFEDNEIDVHIASTSCAGAGMSTSKFASLVKSAAKKYWNAVPTSALYLDVKGVGSIDIDGDTHSAALAKVPSNSILAGCNDDADGFDNGGSPSNTLGSAVMTCNGDTCRAVLIINAHADSQVPSLSDSEVEATIAHEIGHAFGLGHSEYKYSLMYFSTGSKTQKWLGQDDIDGVSYLYPHDAELLGLLGSCATISDHNDSNGSGGNFLISFIFALLLVFGFKIIKKPLRIKSLN